MFLDPLLAAPRVIQAHAFAAMGAFALGLFQFAGIKGSLTHRIIGWIWVGLMIFAAATSFWINEIRMWGAFSPIHLLGVLVLVLVPLAVLAARRHKVQRHAMAMTSLFIGALVIAGLFTFMPGRIMYDVLFGTNIAGS